MMNDQTISAFSLRADFIALTGSASAQAELIQYIPPPFPNVLGEMVPDWNSSNVWPLSEFSPSQLLSMLLSGVKDDMIGAYSETLWRIGDTEQSYSSVIQGDGFKIDSFRVIYDQLNNEKLDSMKCRRWTYEQQTRHGKLLAIERKQFRLFQFLTNTMDKASSTGPKREPGMCAAACRTGSLTILRWAFENSYPADHECSVAAALKGHIGCLKYVTEHQFYKHPLTLAACDMSNARPYRSQFEEYCRINMYPSVHVDVEQEYALIATVRRVARGLPEIVGWQQMTSHVYEQHQRNQEAREEADRGIELQQAERASNEREHREQERARRLEEGRFRYPADWQAQLNAREIVVNSGPDAGYQQNAAVGGKCFDVGSQTQMHVRRYLQASADNIVVLLADGQPRCATRSRIQSYRVDNDHVFMPCAAQYVGSVDRSIRLIRIPLDYNIFVPETDLIRLDTEQDVQIWQLVESQVVVPRTAALTAVDGHDFVSVSHCQDGTQKTLTRIIPVRVREQDPTPNRPNDQAPPGPRRSKRSRTSLEQTSNTSSINTSTEETDYQQNTGERKRKQPSRKQ